LRWRQYLLDAQRGDPEAFRRLYEELTPRLRRWLHGCPATAPLFTLDPDGVEDVLQVTWLRVFEHLDSCDAERGGAGWVWRITRNAAVEALRKWKRRPAARSDVVETALADAAPDDGPGLLEGVAVSDWQTFLACERAGMKPGERRVFDARFLEGKKLRVIAEQLGMPRNTVGIYVYRLVRRLRAAASELMG
jgi:RNA polymerase sigma-70 factor (ECF subfamily)